MKKVIVALGLPGSGKTTYLERYAEEHSVPRINQDEIRKKIADSEIDQSKNNEVWKQAMEELQVALAHYDTVIFDSTLARHDQRLQFLESVRALGADRILGVYFTAPFSVVQKRNTDRLRTVPEHVMLRMHEQLHSDPPDRSDGFDVFTTLSTDRPVAEVYAELQRVVSDTINPELSKLR